MRNRDLTQELMDEMAAADTQTMAAPPVEAKPIKPPPPMKKKKKTSKSLVLLFILILLGAAVYLLPKYTDIKLPAIKMPDLSGIPFIGDFMGGKSPEAIVPAEASLKGRLGPEPAGRSPLHDPGTGQKHVRRCAQLYPGDRTRLCERTQVSASG
jgi:hypothetical protein